MAKKKARPGARKRKGAKTDLVLGLPESMPASEVVAKAKEQGVSLTEKYVWSIRSAHRVSKKKKRAKTAPKKLVSTPPVTTQQKGVTSPSAPAPAATNGKSVADQERSFLEIIVQIGIARAEHLVAEAKQRLRTLFGTESVAPGYAVFGALTRKQMRALIPELYAKDPDVHRVAAQLGVSIATVYRYAGKRGSKPAVQ